MMWLEKATGVIRQAKQTGADKVDRRLGSNQQSSPGGCVRASEGLAHLIG